MKEKKIDPMGREGITPQIRSVPKKWKIIWGREKRTTKKKKIINS